MSYINIEYMKHFQLINNNVLDPYLEIVIPVILMEMNDDLLCTYQGFGLSNKGLEADLDGRSIWECNVW